MDISHLNSSKSLYYIYRKGVFPDKRQKLIFFNSEGSSLIYCICIHRYLFFLNFMGPNVFQCTNFTNLVYMSDLERSLKPHVTWIDPRFKYSLRCGRNFESVLRSILCSKLKQRYVMYAKLVIIHAICNV